jgi:arylsulfatase
MRRHSAIILLLPIIGTLAGLWLGRSEWSDLWPELSRLNLAWRVGQGWLAGFLVFAVLLLLARGGRPTKTGRWRRAVEGVLVATALAPAGLWMTLALPDGVMRKAAPRLWPLHSRRPNIVLIGVDALRADHLGAYGSKAGLTPNLDKFADEATVYEAAYASSPWTLASLGAVFTSLPPSQCIVMKAKGEEPGPYVDRVVLRKGVELLPQRLRRAGYLTAAELTNPFLARERGWAQGFRDFRNEDGWEIKPLITDDSTRAETITRNASQWLQLTHRQPFFLWLHYLDTHAPYDSPDTPAELRERYPRDWDTGRAYYYDEKRKEDALTGPRYEQFCREMYAEEVRYADRWVGELLEELQRVGGYDNSIIVIMSDHGEELFDHGGFEHGHSMHEEVLRVPLLVKWPRGVKADQQISQTVALTDLADTFLELARVPMGEIQGRPLPRRDGEPGVEVFSEGVLYGAEQTALTSDRYKAIYHLPASGPGRFEVYDREADRGERRDLSKTGAARDLRERLRVLTEAVMARRVTGNEEGAPRREVGEEARRKLRSLGYLGD